jgi:hypothetical protein
MMDVFARATMPSMAATGSAPDARAERLDQIRVLAVEELAKAVCAGAGPATWEPLAEIVVECVHRLEQLASERADADAPTIEKRQAISAHRDSARGC